MIASVTFLFYLIVITFIIIIILFFLMRLRTNLIFGIYPPKGHFYRLKYYIARLLVQQLRYKFYPKDDNCPNVYEDNVQQLKYIDSYDTISFMGANQNGEKLIISLERRRYGILKACFYLYLPEKGLLALPKLPDMLNFTTIDGQDADVKMFNGCGFTIYPETPLEQWHILYKGPLKHSVDETLIDITLDIKFIGHSLCFNYNRDLSSDVIADAIARESWNSQFYSMLGNVNRILNKRLHYDQNGSLKGTIQIANEPSRYIELMSFRDHSFGIERCLSTINRYVYVALFLSDGSSMVVGALSQPSFFLSSLKIGYICTADGQHMPITDCNFELYSYGEKGQPPQYKNFLVSTETAEYFVQIREETNAIRYAGRNWNSKIYNQFVSCCVNGLHGHGITEYLYRYEGGRPHELRINDPEWFQHLCKMENDDSIESF